MWALFFTSGELCIKRAISAKSLLYFVITKENSNMEDDGMDKVASKIVDSMLTEQMITNEDRSIYIYSLQMIMEKVIGYVAIFILAIVFNLFLPTVMFILFFGTIRKYSGGFHLSNFSNCFIMSVGVYIIMCKLVYPMLPMYSISSLIFAIVAGVLVVFIGAINNPNIHWNTTEFEETTALTRYVALIETGVIICMFILGCNSIYLWFMSLGVVLAALLLVIEKVKKLVKEHILN